MCKRYLLSFLTLMICYNATAQTSNLIGLTKARYDSTSAGFMAIGDSAWYMYSGTNDTSNAGAWAYDSSYVMAYMNGFTANNNSYRYYQTISTNKNITNIISQYYDSLMSTWANYQNRTNTYDANNNLTQNILQVWDDVNSAWLNNRNTLNTFSSNNNTLKIVQLWNTTSSAWVNSTKDSFSYDVSNNMLYHLVQIWDTSNLVWLNTNQYTYTYNANMVATTLRETWDPIGSAWMNNSNTFYTYYTNNLLANTIVQRWDTTNLNWRNFSADTVTYYGTSSDKMADLQLRWDTTNLVWNNRTLDLFTYDAAHNMLSDTTYSWSIANSVFNYSRLRTYTYNTHDQTLVSTSATWSNTNQAWYYRTTGNPNNQDVQWRYYYGTGIPNSVNSVQANNNSLHVYPSPANDLLNIKIDWTENTPFTVEIVDMNGGVVRKWKESAKNNYTRQIVVSDLPVGNYIIKAGLASSQIAQRFLIAR